MTLREAFIEGFRTEQLWNADMAKTGHEYALLPVPRTEYRVRRGVRFAVNIIREKLAGHIAPWIVYPAILEEHGIER